MRNSPPTVLRISNENRDFIARVGEDLGGLSMNWVVNRILYCERKGKKYIKDNLGAFNDSSRA